MLMTVSNQVTYGLSHLAALKRGGVKAANHCPKNEKEVGIAPAVTALIPKILKLVEPKDRKEEEVPDQIQILQKIYHPMLVEFPALMKAQMMMLVHVALIS